MSRYTHLWIDILNEQRIATLPDRLWRRTVELMIIKSLEIESLDEMAHLLRIDSATLLEDMRELLEAGILRRGIYTTTYFRGAPAGIRLIDWDLSPLTKSYCARISNPEWPSLRASVMERDRSTCQYCGKPAEHVDHIIPKCQGGTDEPDNLVAACAPCNLSKGGRTPEQAGMELL